VDAHLLSRYQGGEAIKNDLSLGLGVNVIKGNITNSAIAEIFDMEYKTLEVLI